MMLNGYLVAVLVALFSLLTANGFPVKRDLSDQTSSNSINDVILETIVPPYRMAYSTLNDDIVQPLLVADAESDQGNIAHLVESLIQAAKKVHSLLHKAAQASELVRASIDEEVTQVVLVVSTREEQVRESETNVMQATNSVDHAQKQVNIAQSAVNGAVNAVNTANHEYYEAERAVQRARRCGLGRRKKRFLGFLGDVLKLPCSVINHNGINRAKNRRTMAGQTLNNEQQRLHNHQQTLNTLRTQLSTAQTQLVAANQALQTAQSMLSNLREKQSIVASLTTKIKNVEEHLNNVLGRSKVLVADTAKLIDFELVIHPLNGIYEEMINNKIMESFGFQITAETAREISVNLQKLTEKMAEMQINELVEKDSDPSRIDSGEAPGNDTVSEMTEPSETNSTEASDHDTTDEEVTNAPGTDSTEVPGYDIATEVSEPSNDTSNSEITASDEAYGYDALTEVTDVPVVDSTEATDDNTADEEEVTQPSKTKPDDVPYNDVIDLGINSDGISEQ